MGMTTKPQTPKLVTPLDAHIFELPNTLGEITNFDELRQISIDLNAVYEKFCFSSSPFASLRNNRLLFDLMYNVNIMNKGYAVQMAVYYSIATKDCKLAVCDVFSKNWTIKNKLLE
jgi:hypothetical protein